MLWDVKPFLFFFNFYFLTLVYRLVDYKRPYQHDGVKPEHQTDKCLFFKALAEIIGEFCASKSSMACHIPVQNVVSKAPFWC